MTNRLKGGIKKKYMAIPIPIPISQQFAIGIDIGGTNTKFGLVNHRGDISYHGAILTHKHERIEEFIDDLYEAIIPAIEQFRRDRRDQGYWYWCSKWKYL